MSTLSIYMFLFGFNRNIMGCKCELLFVFLINIKGFNRNIMGCKSMGRDRQG